MRWLIHRYIIFDLLRVIGLTAAVLVVVIAFGATIKPLAKGGLSPTDIIRFVGYAIVPMLPFALPFAAGFGSTIVWHRMVEDNEVVAVAASGMGYGKLLRPVIAMGVVLSIILWLLTQFVVPYFWTKMEKTIAKDAHRLLESAISQGEAFTFGDLQIFADDVQVIDNPPGTDARHRLLLNRVAAAEFDDEEQVIVTEVTAARAVADFYEREESSYLKLALEETVVYRLANNQLAHFPRLETRAVPVENAFRRDPKFMSLPRLLETQAEPDLYVKVDQDKVMLSKVLQRLDIWGNLNEQLKTNGQLTFESTQEEEPLTIILNADRFRDYVFTDSGVEPVVVEFFKDEQLVRTIDCQQAGITIVDDGAFGLIFDLLLIDGIVKPGDGSAPYARSQELIPGITFAGQDTVRFFAMTADELVEEAESRGNVKAIESPLKRLKKHLIDLDSLIVSEIASRNATAATGFLLLMLGTVLALVMRNSLPLTIYIIAFLPAIAGLIIISGGSQLIREEKHMLGQIVMWSGNAVMLLMIIVAYLKLRKN